MIGLNDKIDIEPPSSIGIYPLQTQLDTWSITYWGNGISIGATGEWRDFGKEPMNWKTYGLTGCTMAIITVGYCLPITNTILFLLPIVLYIQISLRGYPC